MTAAQRLGTTAPIPEGGGLPLPYRPATGAIISFPRRADRLQGDSEHPLPGACPRAGRYAPWALAISAALHLAVLAAVGSVLGERVATSLGRSEPAIVQVYLPSALHSAIHPMPERVLNSSPPVASHVAEPVRAAHVSRPTIRPEISAAPPEQFSKPTTGTREEEAASHPAVANDSASVEPAASAGAPAGTPKALVAEAMPAAYLHTPEPEYPQAAREDEEEGLVVLRVRISIEGLPAEILLARSSGFPLLDRAAMAGVRRWTFVPATNGQRRIDSWMEVPIRFHLT